MKRTKVIFLVLTVFLAMAVFTVVTSAQQDVYYARDTIDGNVAYVYDKLCEDLLCSSPKTEISLDEDKKVTSDEVSLAMELFLSDHPECFWINGGYGYSSYSDGTVVTVSPEYNVDLADIPLMRAQLESVVSSIIETVPSGDNYEKALYLHDVVAKHTEYVYEGLHQTAYGALVSGKAVCAGYASAYQLLLQRVGICSWRISGQSYEPNTGLPEPHAWNMVMIEEGVCLYTDVTWDDQGEHLYRAYFNNSLEQISKTHFEDTTAYKLPDCSHTGYGYFDKNGAILDGDDKAQTLADMFVKVTEDEAYAVFKFDGDGFEQWISDNSGELYQLLGGSGGYSYRLLSLDGEIHLWFSGSFDEEKGNSGSDGNNEIPDFEKNPDVEVPSESNSEAPPTQEPNEDGEKNENGGSSQAPSQTPPQNEESDSSQAPSQDPSHDGSSTPQPGGVSLFGCRMSAVSGLLTLVSVIAAGAVFFKKK